MKKTSLLEVFKKGLGEIPSGFFRFIKKFIVTLVFYALIALIPIAIAFLIRQLVMAFAQDASVAGMVFKILATIGQVIPLSFSLYLSEWELPDTDEDSVELCFVICALLIAILWIN